MRVLVAEPIASEGVALLRAHHQVDERPGLSRDELCAIMPDYDALIVRSQVQVDEGLRLMNAEGAEAIFARHQACAAASRAGLTALGFELFADPRHASKTVTAAVVPDDLDWKSFNGELKRRGLVLAGGQGKLTGKIFRLGHLGSVTVEEILGAMSTLEIASIAAGRSIRPGAAVAAAQVAALESFGIVTPTAAGAGA